MYKTIDNIKIGDKIKIWGRFREVTDKRYNDFPRNSQGESYVVTIQTGPHCVNYVKNDYVKVRWFDNKRIIDYNVNTDNGFNCGSIPHIGKIKF